jgi:hypothetical protein
MWHQIQRRDIYNRNGKAHRTTPNTMRSKFEIKAQKELESQNWIVDYKCRPFRVPKDYNVDFMGLFDLMAYRAGDPLRLISVKGTAGVPSAHRQAIENFTVSLGGVQKEIWTYRKLVGSKNRFTPRKEIIE